MFGIKYFKAAPIEYARVRVNGETRKEGRGISAIYIPFRTSIEVVSLGTQDQPFVFQEKSQDNQEVALQGGIVYRVVDPQKAADQYNFSVDSKTRYLTEDPRKIPQHILQLVRGEAKQVVQATPLEKLLVMGQDLSSKIAGRLVTAETISGMGVEFRNVYFEAITPNPEIAKALEAEFREGLLQKADGVIYARRAQAVENERVIRENEMKTEIEIEQRRKELVELQGINALRNAEDEAKATLIEGEAKAKNTRIQGEARAEATKKELEAYEGVDPLLMGARALYEFCRNVKKVGDITITPELLASASSLVKYIEKNGTR